MKKLISLLLIAILSVCLLSCGNKANSINKFAFGSEDVSSETEILNWAMSYAEEIEKENEEYSLRPKKWYKIDFESAKYAKTYPNIDIYDGENESSTIEYSEHVKCSGWYLATPYDFEKKYSLSFNYTVKKTTIDKDGVKKVEKRKVSVDEVYIEGVTYTKKTTTVTEGKNKSKFTEYLTSSYVLKFISQSPFDTDVFALLDNGTLLSASIGEIARPTYVKNRKIAYYDVDNGDFTHKTNQFIVQLESNSPYIKGLKLYNKVASISNPENLLPSLNDGESDKREYDNVSVNKLSVNPSFFGFVSRPSDYYKYF